MNFFGRQKTRSPTEAVKGLKECIIRMDQSSGESRRKTSEEASKLIGMIKVYLQGESGAEPVPDIVAQVANEIYVQDLLSLLIIHMEKLEFEARKDTCNIYSALLRRQLGSRSPTIEYLSSRPDIIFATLKSYEDPEIALNTGMILKEMLRSEPLARVLLQSDYFFTFPQYIEGTTFGISCDAFANLKEALTRHKPLVAQWLDANYDRFFSMYNTLILSGNYVTKRQSLKLLGEILLDRANYNIMTRYISDDANLKMMMNFLRDKSRNIQFEAFHVFKVFVANPNKPPQIASILRRNKDKLLSFLREFHNDKDDEQFNDEKSFLIEQIKALYDIIRTDLPHVFAQKLKTYHNFYS